MYKIIILISLIVISSCQKQEQKDNKMRANELAQKFIITDGHVDLPYRLDNKYEDVSVKTEQGNMDYVRAKTGGLDAPFMSIYVGAEHQKKGEGSKEKKSEDAFDKALSLISIVEGLVEKYPTKYAMAYTPQDIIENKKLGKISLPMGMENGAPIAESIENLNTLFKKGIRYITLTHSEWNHLGDSSYDTERKWNGLSPFGKKVVMEMNKLGIMVDISHVSDQTFHDVMKITKAPVIASHSSARHFTPGFERNMSDTLLMELKKNNGVIMINFGSSFLTEKANMFDKSIQDRTISIMKEKGIELTDMVKGREIYDSIKKDSPYPYATLSDVADHIDYIVKLIGIDHVGLGSDYDGVDDTLPVGLKDVSTYPNLIEELLNRGYSETDIEKICYKNLFRVWNKVIDISKSLN